MIKFKNTNARSASIAILMASSCLATLTLSTNVFAQEAKKSGGVEEVVITAQRKSQSLQKAAIAVDAVKGSDLISRGITDAYSLTKVVPALNLSNTGGNNASVYMRGVGNKTTSSYADPAVAISYDGVFMGRASGASSAGFYDIERVEVLKGPQGILYGRNATGGAVNILPASAKIGSNFGGATLGLGNYNAKSAQGFYNFKLGDTAALRLAGNYQKRDGFNRDGTDDLDSQGLRAQFFAKISDDISVKIGADYAAIGGKGPGATYVGNYNPGASGYTFVASGFDESEGTYTDAAQAYRETLLLAPGFGFATKISDAPYLDNKYTGLNAEFNVNTPLGKLTIIPAFREANTESKFSIVAFNSAYVQEESDQTSIEARLSGKVGGLEYILGAYKFDETLSANNTYNQEFVLPLQEYTQKSDSYALFGNLTYNVSDNLRLVGGARYTNDTKNFKGRINNFITFCGGIPPTTPPASFGLGCQVPGNLPHFPTLDTVSEALAFLTSNGWIAANTTLASGTQVFPLLNGMGVVMKTDAPVDDGGTTDKITGKLSVEYDVAKDSLFYATVETGYRAGGYQLSEGRTTYDPETITAYTIGSKNRFFDRKLQANFELFYWDYQDQQISYFTYAPDGTIISSTENIGAAVNKGFDIDLVYSPTSATRFDFKVQYLDAKYEDLHFITAAPRDNFGCDYSLTGETSGGAPVKDFDCSGNQAVFSPKWTVNMGASHTLEFSALDVTGSVNAAWKDEQQGGFEYLAEQVVPAYWTFDADVTFANKSGDTSLTAFVSNISDERQIASPQLAPTGQMTTVFGAPRTYGVRLSKKF